MGSGQPTVSFVVPCCNYGRFLPDCLNSIAAQKGCNFEVLLIDDGSTDDTQEVAQRFSGLPLRVITHRNNLGLVATLNEGLREARGIYVARIDADDRYRPYFLAETLRVFEKFPSVSLVYEDIAAMNARGEIIPDPWPGIRSREAHGGKDFKGCEYLPLVEEDFIRKAQDGESFEKTVLRMLSHFFSEEDPCMTEKLRMRRRVYASAYRDLINAYSGMHRGGDCWRCFFEMLSYRPDYAFQAEPLKKLLATFLGWDRYKRLAHFY